MRATLTTISVVALLATGAGTASARPDVSSNRTDAAIHAQAMRAQGLHYEQLAASREPVPAPIVRVTRVADGGFAWIDAGIGAGLAAALLLSAAAVTAVRRQPRMTTR